MAAEALEALECPICMTLPEGEVHQCNEGHCCCVRCWNRLDPRRCPECRQPVPLANRNKAIERTIAALAWSCEHCGETTTRGAKAAHLSACPQQPCLCAAAKAGCCWVGIGAGQAAHEAACPFAICLRMMAPLQAWCDGLQAENHRLKVRVRALEDELLPTPEEGGRRRRLRQRVGPAPHDAPPSDVALAAMGLVELIAALWAHIVVVRVANYACERVNALCLPADTEQAAAEAGVLEAVVEAMLEHPQVSSLQHTCCASLANVCCGGDAAEDARKQRAVEEGAIEAVVDAMRAHLLQEAVQEHGCRALYNMCMLVDGEEADLTRKRRASQAGGRTATAAAMEAHPDNTEVQDLGQELLDALPE